MTLRSNISECNPSCFLYSPFVLLTVVLGCGAVSGCSSSSGRQGVSGTVHYQGKPLPQGHIVFRPTGRGQAAGAVIQDGEFRVPSTPGLVPGMYRVEIKAMRDVGEPYIDPESGLEERNREQYLPDQYNTQSKITIEITESGENFLPLDIRE